MKRNILINVQKNTVKMYTSSESSEANFAYFQEIALIIKTKNATRTF